MPNWCYNFITISGSKEKMKPLFDYFDKSTGEVNEVHRLQMKWLEENPEGSVYSESSIEHKENPVMRTLIPHDEEYKKIEESGDFLLNPQTEFYGCKWDYEFHDISIAELDESCISYGVDTAWAPCEHFCNKIAKKFGVDVTIEYSEPGCDFAGKGYYTPTSEDDEVYEYREGIYRLSDNFWEEFNCYLDDYFDNEDFEEPNFEEFMKEEFPFISDEQDMKTARTWFDSTAQLYNEKSK